MYCFLYLLRLCKLIIFGIIFLSSSFVQAAEIEKYKLPSVKEQVSLYAQIWKEVDNPKFDPTITPVPRLAEPLSIAHNYVQQAIGAHEERLSHLKRGIQYISSKELTLKNFIIYNYFLAFLLTDIVFDRLNAIEVNDYQDINWKDIDSFFSIFSEGQTFRSYPFCFEGVIYAPTGTFDLDDYFDAVLCDDASPFSLSGLPLWGNSPHAGIVSTPWSFFNHDRAHSGMLFDYYDNLNEGIVFWQQTRTLLRKLLTHNDMFRNLRKHWLFSLNHEDPLPPNLLLSKEMPLIFIQDESVESLPLCQKRMLLNWTNSSIQSIERHRFNSSNILSSPLHTYFEEFPLRLGAHQMTVSTAIPLDLGLEGEKSFVQEVVISSTNPSEFCCHFTANLKGIIIPGNSRGREKLIVNGIDSVAQRDSQPIDKDVFSAFKTSLTYIHFESDITSRWADYAMYLYDTSKLMKEADKNNFDIMDVSVNLQIDRIRQFLEKTYRSYVSILSEQPIDVPPFHEKQNQKP